MSTFARSRISRKDRRRRPAGGASGSVGSRVAPLPTAMGRRRLSRARELQPSDQCCPPKLLIVQCRLFGDDPVAEPRGAAGSRQQQSSASSISPCGGECRVGRTLLRGGPSSPARGADPRRRQHRPIATNKPSTSAAAQRPPIATHSAAQAAGAGRAPRRSISHAHRCPRRCAAASRSSNINTLIFPRKRISQKRNRRRRPAGGASGSAGSRVAPLPTSMGRRAPRAHEDSARVWLICHH